MSNFSRDEVQRLADLARLELTADEADRFARQLGDILGFVRQIQSVDIPAGAVTPPAGTPSMPLRADTVRPCLPREEVLAAAPEADAGPGVITVPRVLER